MSASSCALVHARSAPVPLEIPEPPPRAALDPISIPEKPSIPIVPEKPSVERVSPPPVRIPPPAAAAPTPAAPVANATPPPVSSTPPSAPASPELRPSGTAAQSISANEVREMMERTTKKLAVLNRARLSAGQQADYDAARRFLSQAQVAVKENNLMLAQYSADKAETLADGLK